MFDNLRTKSAGPVPNRTGHSANDDLLWIYPHRSVLPLCPEGAGYALVKGCPIGPSLIVPIYINPGACISRAPYPGFERWNIPEEAIVAVR